MNITQGWSSLIQLLQTELSDTKQQVDMLNSQVVKLQEDNKALEVRTLIYKVLKYLCYGTYLFIYRDS